MSHARGVFTSESTRAASTLNSFEPRVESVIRHASNRFRFRVRLHGTDANHNTRQPTTEQETVRTSEKWEPGPLSLMS